MLRIPIFALALLVSATSACAEAKAPDTELVAALQKQRSTLALRNGQLIGPAAEAMLDEARAAQFVLIGEDHGFAEVPEFAAALQRSLGSDAPTNLVVEIGPYSAARVEQALRQDRAELTELNQQYPSAVPFLSLREDGDLAARFVSAKDHTPRLWGIDQEFILSAEMHLATLSEASENDAQLKKVRSLTQRAVATRQRMVEQHDASALPLLEFTDADFAELRTLFKHKVPSQLIEDLAASTAIYRSQNSTPYDSNLARSQLMKRTFLHYYRQAAGTPRALFKMGAFHASRGRSATNLFDIGNLASELAESNGSRSLHILVLCAGGTVNRWFSFVADEKARQTPYQATEELAMFELESLLAASAKDTWSVFDFSQLRRSPLPKSTPAPLRNLIYGYDRVVVIPKARAATLDE